ncbi:MAG: hypothetical protein RBT70_02595 [Alphaproteobacteria bacterium]|nr:hypothetical protein [Alphaproteobacteria bacterium]
MMDWTDKEDRKFPGAQLGSFQADEDRSKKKTHWKVDNPGFFALILLSAASTLLTNLGDKDPNIIKKNYINRAISQVVQNRSSVEAPAAVREIKIKAGEVDVGNVLLHQNQKEGSYLITRPYEGLQRDIEAAKEKVVSKVDTIGGLPTLTAGLLDGQGRVIQTEVVAPNLWNEQVAYYSSTMVRGVHKFMVEQTIGEHFNAFGNQFNNLIVRFRGQNSSSGASKGEVQLASASRGGEGKHPEQHYAATWSTRWLHGLQR